MDAILQTELPEEMRGPPGLPGTAPCGPADWLRVDEAYAAQMSLRASLLAERRGAVYWLDPRARDAAAEVLAEALTLLPGLGFDVGEAAVTCPDGRRVPLDHGAPLLTLGHLVQEDICLMDRRGDEHVLVGAVLCFPASWRLAEKAGRPLVAIHEPVAPYDAGIARRVQRLFDGVRAGRPLWRFNRLSYGHPALHQPHRLAGDGTYTRAERQCILRLPRSGAVAFTIHTYVVAG